MNLKIQGRILPVQIDIDSNHLAWASPQAARIFNVVRAAVIKDLGIILEKERGALLVTSAVAIAYVILPSGRRDHLLVGDKMERPEIFPYQLCLKLYPPDHLF